MTRTIWQKELREVLRDGRFRVLGALIAILTLAALLFGVQEAELAAHEREHAMEQASAQWENQGEKNPHVAAHYGTHIFAPATVTTAMDPGVSPYLGRSIKVIAHERNLAENATAGEQSRLTRLDRFSVAMVFLLLIPLVILALGYGMWSHERERGTLRQVMSTGVSRLQLFKGKLYALLTLVALMFVPAMALIGSVLWWLSGGDSDTLARLAVLTFAYALYFVGFGGVALFVSARVRFARTGLVLLVGVWGVFCLLAPRVAVEVSSRVIPLPSEAQLMRHITESLENGVGGNQPREEGVEAILDVMMAEQGMENIGLIVDQSVLSGIELQAEAAWEDQAYDHHIEAYQEQILRQEQQNVLWGFVSPFIAMRTLSSGLSGTDYSHHLHFSRAVEVWRKSFVDYLNRVFAEKAGDEGWNYKADKTVWREAPPFAYSPPGVAFALRTHLWSLIALALWASLAILLAAGAARKVRVTL